MAKKRKPKPRPKVSEHKEAVAWFRARVPVSKEDWLEMTTKARKRSFTVAHVLNLDIINDTLKALTRAIEKGETLQQFKKRVGDKLERAWGEERAWHLDVIFKNNVQAAYSHGREALLRDPAVLDVRPYWMFDAVLDDRTTKEICRPIAGKILPATHVWWQTHTPPLHHRCRSIKRALTPEQARARGISRRAPAVEAQDGWGHADPLDYEPDLSAYPPNLVRQYKRKRR